MNIFYIAEVLHMVARTRKKIGNSSSLILGIISGIIIFWVALSFVDVVMHNSAINPQYAAWNIIVILIHCAPGH